MERLYCPFYCEENVYHLCRQGTGADDAYAVFISNARRQVALLGQRAGASPHSLVVWDYHVIALFREDGVWNAHDWDTTFGPCVSLNDYLYRTFPPLSPAEQRFAPKFRVVPATDYLQHFASDRRHMRDANGGWLAPPPAWPPIGDGSNLMDFVDMEKDFYGEVFSLGELPKHFLTPAAS